MKACIILVKFFGLHLDRLLDKDKGEKRALGFAVDLGQPSGTGCAWFYSHDF